MFLLILLTFRDAQNRPNKCNPYTKIDCTHFVSGSFANVPLLQKWPVLGAVSLTGV